jgi:hypothetical protein
VFAVRQRADYSTSELPVRGVAAASGGLDSTLAGIYVGGGEVLVARTLAGATVWARSFGSVLGMVTDSANGGGVTGAQVELRGTTHHTRTDSAGAFHLDSVPPGAYTLLVNVLSPVLLARSMAVRVDSGPIRVAFALPVSTLAKERTAREQARRAMQCAELQAARDREIDSTMAEPAVGWIPHGRDSAEVRRAIARAAVVLQAVADTTGHVERTSVRALRGGTSAAYATALAALLALEPEVDEPVAGCRLRRLILLPYRVSR